MAGIFGDVLSVLGAGNSAPTDGQMWYAPVDQTKLINGTPIGSAAQGAGRVQQAGLAQLDLSQANQSRGFQNNALGMLQQQAMGQGPSLANLQLQQGTENNIRQQAGLMAGNRNNPMASWLAANNAGAAGQQMAGQAAQNRMGEQMQAQGLLSQLAGQMRGQDLDSAGQNAQLAQQANLFNAGQYNQQLGQDVGAQNQFKLQQAAMDQQVQLANQQAQNQWNATNAQIMANQYAQHNGYLQNYALQNQGAQNQFAGGMISGAGSALQMLAGI